MNLKNKRILITAGPTWVPIDSVRIISNIATGETGILLAEKLIGKGAKVTLLLGPGNKSCLNSDIKVIPFNFLDKLSGLLKNELKKRYFDVVINTAAVSDYRPSFYRKKKISSGHKTLKLILKQTPKIIDSLRKLCPKSFLVGFKFEPDLTGARLIKRADRLLKRAHLDLVVANTMYKKHYIAYLVSAKMSCGPFSSKEKMANDLTALIGEEYAGN